MCRWLMVLAKLAYGLGKDVIRSKMKVNNHISIFKVTRCVHENTHKSQCVRFFSNIIRSIAAAVEEVKSSRKG